MGIKGLFAIEDHDNVPDNQSPSFPDATLTAGLNALLSEHAPRALRDHEMKTVCTSKRLPQQLTPQLFGRKVAIDASM